MRQRREARIWNWQPRPGGRGGRHELEATDIVLPIAPIPERKPVNYHRLSEIKVDPRLPTGAGLRLASVPAVTTTFEE